jgi:hypothetical protein
LFDAHLEVLLAHTFTWSVTLLAALLVTQVELVEPPEGVPPGERVTFEGYPGEADEQLNPKKKIFETVGGRVQVKPKTTCQQALRAELQDSLHPPQSGTLGSMKGWRVVALRSACNLTLLLRMLSLISAGAARVQHDE